MLRDCVGLESTGAPVPLLRYAVEYSSKGLSCEDLRLAVRKVGLACRRDTPRDQLIAMLLDHWGIDNDGKQVILNRDVGGDGTTDAMADDPFAEHVFQQMDPDDQKEWDELNEKIKKKREKRKVQEWCLKRAVKRRGRVAARAAGAPPRADDDPPPEEEPPPDEAPAPLTPPAAPVPAPPAAPVGGRARAGDRLHEWFGPFKMVDNISHGEWVGISCECPFHGGGTCSADMTWGTRDALLPEEVVVRLKRWALRGYSISDDGPHGCHEHMKGKGNRARQQTRPLTAALLSRVPADVFAAGELDGL